MFNDVLVSVGEFRNARIENRYLKREETTWDGNVHIRHDSGRNRNIEKVRMAMDTISTTTSIYGDLLQSMVDFENSWMNYTNTLEKLQNLPTDFDLRESMLKMSESRNKSAMPQESAHHLIRRCNSI